MEVLQLFKEIHFNIGKPIYFSLISFLEMTGWFSLKLPPEISLEVKSKHGKFSPTSEIWQSKKEESLEWKFGVTLIADKSTKFYLLLWVTLEDIMLLYRFLFCFAVFPQPGNKFKPGKIMLAMVFSVGYKMFREQRSLNSGS